MRRGYRGGVDEVAGGENRMVAGAGGLGRSANRMVFNSGADWLEIEYVPLPLRSLLEVLLVPELWLFPRPIPGAPPRPELLRREENRLLGDWWSPSTP